MPTTEMSQKAWFVYEGMKRRGINPDVYSGSQLESLYDSADSLAIVMGNRTTINDSLDSILSMLSQHNKEQIEKKQGAELLLGWKKRALESARKVKELHKNNDSNQGI